MTKTFRLVSTSSIVFIGLLMDQWTKFLAITYLKTSGDQYSFFGGLFQFIYAQNRGAWGNLGESWPPLLRQMFLIWIPIIALIAILVFILISKKIKKSEIIYYALILSGGIGNMIDRVNNDYVIDFLYIGYKRIGTNIFNIADTLIMVGFIGLLLLGIMESLEKRKKLKNSHSN